MSLQSIKWTTHIKSAEQINRLWNLGFPSGKVVRQRNVVKIKEETNRNNIQRNRKKEVFLTFTNITEGEQNS